MNRCNCRAYCDEACNCNDCHPLPEPGWLQEVFERNRREIDELPDWLRKHITTRPRGEL